MGTRVGWLEWPVTGEKERAEEMKEEKFVLRSIEWRLIIRFLSGGGSPSSEFIARRSGVGEQERQREGLELRFLFPTAQSLAKVVKDPYNTGIQVTDRHFD